MNCPAEFSVKIYEYIYIYRTSRGMYISIKCYYFVPMVLDSRTGLDVYFLRYFVPLGLWLGDRNFRVVIL